MRPSVLVLAAALLGSLGVNAWLLSREPLAAPAITASSASGAPELSTCRSALAHCETARSLPSPAAPSALELARAFVTSAPASVDAGTLASPARAPVVSELTPELQQDLLSQVAREKLRDEWKRQESSILSSLRSGLADPAKQHDDAQKEGQKLASEAGLDAAATARFLEAYEARRAARVAAMLQALTPDPPDWSTALDDVRAMFGDEDALAQALGGDDAKKRLRTAQAEGRTVILAIGASLANAPWEQAVRW